MRFMMAGYYPRRIDDDDGGFDQDCRNFNHVDDDDNVNFDADADLMMMW